MKSMYYHPKQNISRLLKRKIYKTGFHINIYVQILKYAIPNTITQCMF